MRKIERVLLSAASLVLAAAVLASCGAVKSKSSASFTWENANVYFLLTDRFYNANPGNDHSYGRGLDESGNVIAGIAESEGSFHGGDFAGVTQKIRDGYFTELGVSAIWITPPYEQVHGFTSAPGFAFYSYHGYWALDFTGPDANYGTEEEFKEMVDAAHEKGIRIVMDVVLNHAGYATMKDAAEYGFGEYKTGWEDYYYGEASALSPEAEESYLVTASDSWSGWWGSDWIRSDDALSGYDRGGTSDTLMSLSGLPDFKTESTEEVGLPPLLLEKWASEGRLEQEQNELDAFFEENKLPKTVLNYEIKWLTDWVAEYGIDGFRCDTAKHIDQKCWAELKKYASLALEEWRKANPGKTDFETPFWTVGEAWDHGVVKDTYFETGMFDAMINFSFRKNLLKGYSILPKLYTFMSDTMRKEDISVLSYISSHDTALYTRSNLIKGGTALLLAPGAVQIYYGDETARPTAWPETPYADQKLRSDMNWENADEAVFTHFCLLGQFRNRHPAVGAGAQTEISQSPYIFARTYETGSDKDLVIVVIGDANTDVSVPVTGYFEDDEKVRNAYDGTETVVKNGSVTFTTGENGVILLEKADGPYQIHVLLKEGASRKEVHTKCRTRSPACKGTR